ncbi:lipoyl(octanoyl) transferase LipB [Persephonella sp.]
MLKIIDLGKTEYQEALNFQHKLFNEKIKGENNNNYFLITEHYPIYTLGKTTRDEHIKNIKDIPIVNVERGGSVTFHGENQIVVYPIIKLNEKISVKKYVYLLEEIIINTLKEFNIESFRVSKHRGVFTNKGKIGFIGVKIHKKHTLHGFSLNVDVNKKYFEDIVPCGITDYPVCNISDFDKNLDSETVKYKLIKNIFIIGRKLI